MYKTILKTVRVNFQLKTLATSRSFQKYEAPNFIAFLKGFWNSLFYSSFSLFPSLFALSLFFFYFVVRLVIIELVTFMTTYVVIPGRDLSPLCNCGFDQPVKKITCRLFIKQPVTFQPTGYFFNQPVTFFTGWSKPWLKRGKKSCPSITTQVSIKM